VTSFLVNIDHIATLRNARREQFPDPVHAAAICESAGADGIVFHLREDRRHITERDVRLLKETVQGRLDFEMATSDEIVRICCEVTPDVATLVPERREEVTTEGGLDVVANEPRLREVIPELLGAGIPEISLFVDPDPRQIERSADVGATCVELHTGDFANAPTLETHVVEAQRLARAARIAHELGLKVHAGHGLNYHNYPIFGAHVPFVEEVSIGFAIIARAVLTGLHGAVEEMNRLVKARYEQSGA
jgi:pyridoxine 5-phosphate synthase